MKKDGNIQIWNLKQIKIQFLFLHSWFSEAMEILVIKIPIDNHWIMNFPVEKCLRRMFGVGVVSTSSEDNSHPSLLPNSWNSNKKSDKEKY